MHRYRLQRSLLRRRGSFRERDAIQLSAGVFLAILTTLTLVFLFLYDASLRFS